MTSLLPLLVPLGIGSWLSSVGSAIMQPLYWAVSGLLVLFHSLLAPVLGSGSGWTWTLSIVLLTVVIRTLTIPLFVKTIRSSRNMQLIQPKVKELQKKYGHDRERLGQETMKLYREEGVNPLASCGPLLLQMPIFFALFRVLDGAARNTARGTFLKNNPDLVTSLREGRIFGARISDTFLPFTNGFGNVQIVTLILVIVMVALTFVTQMQLMRRNMPAEALTGPMAQQQKMMLYVFPLIFGVSGVYFPLGVLIYMVSTTLWTMGQQFYVIRRNPSPGTPAYEAWEARMREKGRDPQNVAAKKSRTVKGAAAEAFAEEAEHGSGADGQSDGRAHGRPAGQPNGQANGQANGHRPAVQRQQPVRRQPNRQSRSQRQSR